jgi:hypothetical protein
MRTQYITIIFIASLAAIAAAAAPPDAHAFEYELRGQISCWHLEARDGGKRYYNLGMRYIPQLSLMQEVHSDHLLDLEISLNGYAAMSSGGREDSDIELYRLKLRYATAQTEIRIGLQKINFGPAFLLRALRWFDRLDPRDPLQLTDGVYGLRFTYNTMSNTSIWLWGLYGNDDVKGYELAATAGERPEFGGRLQFPVPAGELAFTFHTRQIDIADACAGELAAALPAWAINSPLCTGEFTENRFALDGRWDIEIGLWIEAVLQEQRLDLLPYEWTKLVTVGVDYTLALGNGLHVLCEHMAVAASEAAFGWSEDEQTSAFSLGYPVGYLDNLSAIGFYSWERDEYYQYLAWQRTWDNLSLHVSAFHYPNDPGERELFEQDARAAGYGGQIILMYNH